MTLNETALTFQALTTQNHWILKLITTFLGQRRKPFQFLLKHLMIKQIQTVTTQKKIKIKQIQIVTTQKKFKLFNGLNYLLYKILKMLLLQRKNVFHRATRKMLMTCLVN